MMTRIEEIENFLSDFARFYIENPNKEIENEDFYLRLKNYGFSNNELLDRKIDDNFKKWEIHFNTAKSLRVFSDTRSSFLQFINYGFSSDSDCIKLYLSFGKNDIYECVNIIFDYIVKENIKTFSKVANVIRSDGVILRIPDVDDAVKIINFINNDNFLKTKCRITNPFLMRCGYVGMAYDKALSYNDVLSNILQKYFTKKREMHSLDRVSLNDFANFVIDVYNRYFINGDAIYCKDIIRQYDKGDFEHLEDLILNYDNVFALIIYSLDKNTDVNMYFKLISQFQNKNISHEKKEKYFQKIKEKLYQYFINICVYMYNYLGFDGLNFAIKNAFEGNFGYLKYNDKDVLDFIKNNCTCDMIGNFCKKLSNDENDIFNGAALTIKKFVDNEGKRNEGYSVFGKQ